MGYSTKGSIQKFWPDDTDTKFYIADSSSFADILVRAQEKWGTDLDFDKLEIVSEYIHTDCLTFDTYDCFLKITYKKD